jgi:hypothetical protein
MWMMSKVIALATVALVVLGLPARADAGVGIVQTDFKDLPVTLAAPLRMSGQLTFPVRMD